MLSHSPMFTCLIQQSYDLFLLSNNCLQFVRIVHLLFQIFSRQFHFLCHSFERVNLIAQNMMPWIDEKKLKRIKEQMTISIKLQLSPYLKAQSYATHYQCGRSCILTAEEWLLLGVGGHPSYCPAHAKRDTSTLLGRQSSKHVSAVLLLAN